MNQGRLHVTPPLPYAGHARQQKTHAGQTPAQAFSLPHTTLSVRLGRCAFCFFIPALPACQAARGRAALLLSRSPATLPIRPRVATCAICEAAMVEC